LAPQRNIYVSDAAASGNGRICSKGDTLYVGTGDENPIRTGQQLAFLALKHLGDRNEPARSGRNAAPMFEMRCACDGPTSQRPGPT